MAQLRPELRCGKTAVPALVYQEPTMFGQMKAGGGVWHSFSQPTTLWTKTIVVAIQSTVFEFELG